MKYRVDYTTARGTGAVIVDAPNPESAFCEAVSIRDAEGITVFPTTATRILNENMDWLEVIDLLASMPRDEFEELLDRVYSQQWSVRMSSSTKTTVPK